MNLDEPVSEDASHGPSEFLLTVHVHRIGHRRLLMILLDHERGTVNGRKLTSTSFM